MSGCTDEMLQVSYPNNLRLQGAVHMIVAQNRMARLTAGAKAGEQQPRELADGSSPEEIAHFAEATKCVPDFFLLLMAYYHSLKIQVHRILLSKRGGHLGLRCPKAGLPWHQFYCLTR